MKVILGTNNAHKLVEFKQIFEDNNIDIELIPLNQLPNKVEEPVEDGTTFTENAIIKAKYYYECYKMPVITDDSGICVDALGGLPGIYSARYASIDGNNSTSVENRRKLLFELGDETNRKAHYACSVVYYDAGEIILGYGEFHGVIDKEEKGTNGFGYDPIFYLPEYGKTVSEIDTEIKNKLSHRYIAIMEFIEKYQNLHKKQ